MVAVSYFCLLSEKQSPCVTTHSMQFDVYLLHLISGLRITVLKIFHSVSCFYLWSPDFSDNEPRASSRGLKPSEYCNELFVFKLNKQSLKKKKRLFLCNCDTETDMLTNVCCASSSTHPKIKQEIPLHKNWLLVVEMGQGSIYWSCHHITLCCGDLPEVQKVESAHASPHIFMLQHYM